MTDGDDLTRKLGALDATAIGMGTMIGGGIFILPSIAAAQAGPASVFSFTMGGFISLLAALSVSELATDMPRSGGSYYYVDRALGVFFGTIVGFGMWAGLIFATAFYAVGFAQYLTFFYGELPIVAAAMALAILLIALNYYGVSKTGQVQDAIVYTLVALIALFIVTGVPAADADTLRPFNPEGWSAVVATVGTVYVTFIGFEVIATAGGEIENPARNIPLSMVVSVLVPTTLYVLVMLVSTGILPIEELAGSRIPVADVARQSLGRIGAFAMILGAVLATISSANASILSAGRVSFAMGEDVLINWLRGTHDKFQTPHRAIVVTGVGILVLVGIRVGIETLAEVAGFMYLVTYTLVHVSIIRFRRTDPEDYDPEFELPSPLYPVVPLAGILATLFVMTQMRPAVIAGGIGIILVSIAWYGLYVRHQ